MGAPNISHILKGIGQSYVKEEFSKVPAALKSVVETGASALEGAGSAITLGTLDEMFGIAETGADMLARIFGGKPSDGVVANTESWDKTFHEMSDKHPFANGIGMLLGSLAQGGEVGGMKLGAEAVAKIGEKIPALAKLADKVLGRAAVSGATGGALAGTYAFNEDQPVLPNVGLGVAVGAPMGIMSHVFKGAKGKLVEPPVEEINQELQKFIGDKLQFTASDNKGLAAKLAGTSNTNMTEANPVFANTVADIIKTPKFSDAAKDAALANDAKFKSISPKLYADIETAMGGIPDTTGIINARASDYKAILSPAYKEALNAAGTTVSPKSLLNDVKDIFSDPVTGKPAGGAVAAMAARMRALIKSHTVGKVINARDMQRLRKSIDDLVDYPNALNADRTEANSVNMTKEQLREFREAVSAELRSMSPDIPKLDDQYRDVVKLTSAYKLADDLTKPNIDASLARAAMERLDTDSYKMLQQGALSNLYEAAANKSESTLLSQLNNNKALYSVYEQLVTPQVLSRVLTAINASKVSETAALTIQRGLMQGAGAIDSGNPLEAAKDVAVAGSFTAPHGSGATAALNALRDLFSSPGPKLSPAAAKKAVSVMMDPTAGLDFLSMFEELAKQNSSKGLISAISRGSAGTFGAGLLERLSGDR